MDDKTLLGCAREFVVKRGPDTIYITRYTSHHRLLSDGQWWAMIVAGPSNPWYLNRDGRWRYKSGEAWPSARELIDWIDGHKIETLEQSYRAQAQAAV